MGNMFKCVLASGIGSGIPLIVTCTSAFAGLTITCTDGTTTLTDTCPSSSPYEITFNLPNTGTWDVSGTISGVLYTESILVQDLEIELKDSFTVTVDVYSAANDTVSYVGALDGQTHTITTDSDGHATATITAIENQPITFTSSVAKSPSDTSQYYSKAISFTPSTTEIYVMPTSGNKMYYWYGYRGTKLETLSTANGWTPSNTNYTFSGPTYNTNNIVSSGQNQTLSGVGSSSADNLRYLHTIVIAKSIYSGNAGNYAIRSGKDFSNTSQTIASGAITSNVDVESYFTCDATASGNYVVEISGSNLKKLQVNALWAE